MKRRASIAAAGSLIGLLLLMMRRWLLMQGCLGLWLCMLVRVTHRGTCERGGVARGRRCEPALPLLAEALLCI